MNPFSDQGAIAAINLTPSSVSEHLQAAEALIPPDALADSELLETLTECRQSGYHHLWMNQLQELGKQVDLLPAYWQHLVLAAKGMGLEPFIPYFVGKSQHLPNQDWYDMMAGIVVLTRALPRALVERHHNAYLAMKAYVDWLETLDVSHPSLFAARDLAKLRTRFADAKYLEQDPPDATMARLNREFVAMFYGLFRVVMDAELPGELRDAAWPVVAVNTFEIRLGGGLLPSTRVEPWWRGRG